jgi:hypothetical protein
VNQHRVRRAGGEGGDISVKECESGNYSVGTKNLDHYEFH